MGQTLGPGCPRPRHRCQGPSFKPEQIVATCLDIAASLTVASTPPKNGCKWRGNGSGRRSPAGHLVPFSRQMPALDEETEHTPGMLPEIHTLRILNLANQRQLVRASDLDAIGSPRVILTRMTAAGLLERVGRGLYRLPGAQVTEFESLSLVATRVPQAVFCLLTALQFHGLTTQLPRQVWIAMPRGSHSPRIDYPPIRMVQMAGGAHLEGVEEHLCNG
jgi:hypothetical protein